MRQVEKKREEETEILSIEQANIRGNKCIIPQQHGGEPLELDSDIQVKDNYKFITDIKPANDKTLASLQKSADKVGVNVNELLKMIKLSIEILMNDPTCKSVRFGKGDTANLQSRVDELRTSKENAVTKKPITPDRNTPNPPRGTPQETASAELENAQKLQADQNRGQVVPKRPSM